VDLATLTLTRPPGVRLDSGGLAKGLFADVLAETLASHPSFAIDCGGDLAIGGAAQLTRPIRVQSPFDGHILHTFNLRRSGVATSGIGRRSWLDRDGVPAHHLLDPSTGRPAFTGVVQVTALAPSALMAEIQAKAAILSGPRAAPAWLPHGGVIVFDDGSHEVVQPPPVVTLSQLQRLMPA
jgi:thiamine biosynthesis lipoprotein